MLKHVYKIQCLHLIQLLTKTTPRLPTKTNKDFTFRSNICNGCHDLLMMFMNVGDITILYVKGSNYGCLTSRMSRNEAKNLIRNTDLNEKNGKL